MAEQLSLDERDWLLAGLRGLILRQGATRFLSAPIREPSPRDFPDDFRADEASVGRLLRRILGYAGMPDMEVELETFSQPDRVKALDAHGRAAEWGHDGAAAWFAGIAGDSCSFGVAEERIGDDPVGLVATLCHEVAHAWRHFHQLAVRDRDVEERLTDLTTVYLGFGLLTTNGSYRYRASFELDGANTVTRWSHSRLGYLSPEEMSFLLAAQVRARGLSWLARRRLAGKLEANQAASFRWALRKLRRVDELRVELGLEAAIV